MGQEIQEAEEMKVEKIPLDPDKKKYSYIIKAVENGYVVVKYRKYIFTSIVDAKEWIANSLTGKCVSDGEASKG